MDKKLKNVKQDVEEMLYKCQKADEEYANLVCMYVCVCVCVCACACVRVCAATAISRLMLATITRLDSYVKSRMPPYHLAHTNLVLLWRPPSRKHHKFALGREQLQLVCHYARSGVHAADGFTMFSLVFVRLHHDHCQ